MGVVSWVVFGLLAGALAKWVMPGKDGGGLVRTTALGVAGALVGGFIASFLGFGGEITGFDLRSFAVAVGGSLVVLAVFRKIGAR